jgi:hypothetical protein
VDLLDEVAEHPLRHVEVGDDAVLQRADRLDVRRGAADHPLGLGADGQNLLVLRVYRDHGRFVQDYSSAADVNERVRGAKVDSHVPPQEAGQAFRAVLGVVAK